MVWTSVGSRCQSQAERSSMPCGMCDFQKLIGSPTTMWSSPRCRAHADVAMPNGPAPMMSRSVSMGCMWHRSEVGVRARLRGGEPRFQRHDAAVGFVDAGGGDAAGVDRLPDGGERALVEQRVVGAGLVGDGDDVGAGVDREFDALLKAVVVADSAHLHVVGEHDAVV